MSLTSDDSLTQDAPPKKFVNSSWCETRGEQGLPFWFVLWLVTTVMPLSLLCSSSANSPGKIYGILFKDPASWSSANITFHLENEGYINHWKPLKKSSKKTLEAQDLGEVLKNPLLFLHSHFFQEKLFYGSLVPDFNALGSRTHFSFGHGLQDCRKKSKQAQGKWVKDDGCDSWK